MIRTFRLSVLVALAVLLGDTTTDAAGTPEQRCQNGRYVAAAKYRACQQKATGAFFGSDYNAVPSDDRGLHEFLAATAKCQMKYAATWARLQAKASGSGASCDHARYDDHGDGTLTDRLTGLQWEQKTADGSIHDRNSPYAWSMVGGGDGIAANGPAYTSFLATLNGGGCFASQCDWRLPTLEELQTILSSPYPCTTSPCIDQAAFGPTIPFRYWTSTTYATIPSFAWYVNFDDGRLGMDPKGDIASTTVRVRAVRGGL